MKPSEKAKKLGFKSLKQVAKILGVTEQTVFKKAKNNKEFDNLLVGAKLKLSLAQIDFYRDCSARESITFEEWLSKEDF
jgi:predicted alpha/beta-fold hydrolase